MTRVLIVADGGVEMASLTAAIAMLPRSELVRHASGRAPVAQLVAAHQPSLVLIGEMSSPGLTVERLNEVRAAAPDAAVVVVAAETGSRWLASALRAGATAVLPGGLGPNALVAVLEDVLSPTGRGASSLALAA